MPCQVEIQTAANPASGVGPQYSILAFATQGEGGDDEQRLRALLRNHNFELFPFDRRAKAAAFLSLMRKILGNRYDLLMMEGTGVAGGAALLISRLLRRSRYVVSSGDAVAPFLSARTPAMRPMFELYEKLLCKHASGYIGWSPFLVGRALTFGCRQAMTAPGWAPFRHSREDLKEMRRIVRGRLGIGDDEIVFGIAGSLAWNRRVRYCYGYEMVSAIARVRRRNVRVLVVGDGEGRQHIEHRAGDRLGDSVLLTGRVPRSDIPAYLAAMDVGSLPQSMDGVGNFRYTTKLSEYLAAKLPVVTGRIPLAYDLDEGWLWRLAGDVPWGERYINQMARLMEEIEWDEVSAKRAAVENLPNWFDEESQVGKVTGFVNDVIAASNWS